VKAYTPLPSQTLTINGCDLTPPIRTQTSLQEHQRRKGGGRLWPWWRNMSTRHMKAQSALKPGLNERAGLSL